MAGFMFLQIEQKNITLIRLNNIKTCIKTLMNLSNENDRDKRMKETENKVCEMT